MGRVDGKLVIVTGGATGLGESHVRTHWSEKGLEWLLPT